MVALHASDQEGYSAASVSFDIIVAEHDFAFSKASSSNSLPTINVTASQPFELTLNSAVDFAGVVLDDQTVSPDNITALDIDISNLESWLRYDASTRTLSGEPPSDFNQAVLPTIITSSVNQTLNTQVTLAAVPSFFTDDELDPILVSPGTPLTFYLAQFFSNSSDLGNPGDIEFSASFDPPDAGNALHFDSSNSLLTGTVPANVTYDHINVAFTAYSHITHSTSHTRLPISLSADDYAHQKNKHGGLSTAARQKLLLGLKIGFGIVSAFIAIALFFAVMRRCGRVADTAVEGEEGRRAWTAEEMKWYGIGIEVNGERYTPSLKEVDALAARKSSEAPREGPMFGTALSRVLTRTPSNATRSPLSPVGLPISPPMVRKVEFMGRVRATARVVSDKYRRVVSGPRRPVISKPTLILTSDENAGGPSRRGGPILPTINPAALLGSGSRDFKPLDDTNFSQYAPSGPTSLADSSPTSSTDERSIPRRRADFAPPKAGLANPPATHVDDADTRSVDSATSSLASNRTHEAEAVVQCATRATSVRSGASGFSLQVQAPVPGMPAAVETARPRLVPFTSATRVPVPKMPSSFFSPELDGAKSGEGRGEAAPGKTKRVASQMAKVFRGQHAQAAALPAAESADELSTGIEYVRALGDDGRDSLAPSTGAFPVFPCRPIARADRSLFDVPATAERSPVISFSSLESSNHGGPARVERVLARTGERFRFRVPVAHGVHTRGLETRLVSGRPLPRFIRADVAAAGVGITGVPTGGDAGVYEVGVFERGGECVGRIIVEVVERKAA